MHEERYRKPSINTRYPKPRSLKSTSNIVSAPWKYWLRFQYRVPAVFSNVMNTIERHYRKILTLYQ